MVEGQTLIRGNPGLDTAPPAASGIEAFLHPDESASLTAPGDQDVLVPAALQMMLDGLSENVALVAADGKIVATNRKWDRAVARANADKLKMDGNYFEFISDLAVAGDEGGVGILRGLADLCSGKRDRFSQVFVGQGPLAGQNYRVVLSRFSAGGVPLIMVNAHDVSELLDLKRQRRRLGSRLLRAQEDERRRIARDLHDSTAQLLVGLQLSLLRLRRGKPGSSNDALLADCTATVKQMQREIRSFSYICHPPSLANDGLAQAIESIAKGFGERTGLEIEVLIGDIGEASPSTQATVYRITQEALANVHRHAKASRANVWLVGTEKCLHLIIKDDGVGFDLSQIDDTAQLGVGIAGMKERLSDLGGRLAIHKLPVGTAVIASLPRRSLN